VVAAGVVILVVVVAGVVVVGAIVDVVEEAAIVVVCRVATVRGAGADRRGDDDAHPLLAATMNASATPSR
jgi:hypothetical protein